MKAFSPKRVTELEKQAIEFAEQGQWKNAAQTVLQLAQNTPQDTKIWTRAAQCFRFARDYKSAAQTLQNAIGHFIQSSDARSRKDTETLHLALCETFAEGQNWPACEEACRALIALSPRHLPARELLASSLLQMGQIAQSESVVRELVQMSPRDPLYRLKLATLFQIQGRSGEALVEFERVVAAYPDAPFASEAREAIDLLDNLQIQQVVMKLNEQPRFEQQMRADMNATLSDNGFHLTDEGRESLRHMMSDGRLEPAPPKMFLH